MIRTRLVRCLAGLLIVAASLAAAPTALAYYNCEYVINVYASGGQTCERICRFYNNETGAYQGSISMEFQC